MPIRKPFNLKQWIEENRSLLKPPVGNKNLYSNAGDYIVMIVAGPNARKDYHFNQTEELFYQLEGSINVRIQEDGKPVDMQLNEGDMFLLPANTPHRPERPANTIGLVIECKREDPSFEDRLIWYCDNCNHKLHEYKFHLENIEKDFIPRFRDFYGSKELRTCKSCGTIMDTDARFV
jgi:3-hydroxyanthranilate 3,4-dioxygenase